MTNSRPAGSCQSLFTIREARWTSREEGIHEKLSTIESHKDPLRHHQGGIFPLIVLSEPPTIELEFLHL
jgi:hypothetical protein